MADIRRSSELGKKEGAVRASIGEVKPSLRTQLADDVYLTVGFRHARHSKKAKKKILKQCSIHPRPEK